MVAFIIYLFICFSEDGSEPSNCSSLVRAHTVYARCRESESVRAHYNNIYVDDRNKVMYCYIPKVACTTFKALIASSASQTPLTQITKGRNSLQFVHGNRFLPAHSVRRLKSYNGSERAKRIRSYFKFLAVRHPFDRLLSAWRDKRMHGGVKYNATDYQLKKFSAFLQHVANGAKNRHWKPMATTCNPCTMQYNSIVRLERANEDLPLILSKLPDPAGNSNTMQSNNKMSPVSPSDKLAGLTSFYKDIDHSVIRTLLSIYSADFRLFGYGWKIDSSTGSCMRDVRNQKVSRNCC